MNDKIIQSRTKNTFLNVASSFTVFFVKTVLALITRTVFIYYLGKEILGLNGLFTNVLSMLSLAELGIGTAINFSLYKPLSEKNNEQISRLMSFYKKVYRIVGISVLVMGIVLIPFLKYLIKDINSISDVYMIYLLFLVNTTSSYFISYKETLITADQKKYKLLKIELPFTILLNCTQILFLVITKNFIIYLLVQFIIQLLQRIIINVLISREYDYIDFNSNKKISNSDLSLIKKNVKSMFFHKIGDYCINGTDNLIISSFINISTVGLYSNYLTIIALINSFIQMIYNGLTASLGNLIATESESRRYYVFNNMNFIAFILHGISFVVLINIFNDFIALWVGNDYCLDFTIVLCILISFYLTGMRIPCSITKTAAGIYAVDKFTPIIQSIVNLVVSIVLVKIYGLIGVIIGTIISSIVLPSWQRPYIVYKYVLNRSSKEYFKNYIEYALIITLTSILTISLFRFIKISNLLVLISLKIVISISIFITLVCIIFHESEEFKYIIKMIRGVLYEKRIG